MFISYAQNFEDVMLWRALHDVTNGFYIDIGAMDPLVDSVSLAFYEQGWRGVHVEPSPVFAEKLRQARPDETVIEKAVDSTESTIKFFEFSQPGWSTGNTEIAGKHQAAGYGSTEIEVPTLTLAGLLDRYADREIHWLKIDVEGMEKRVIESWKPSQVRPWILVVESTIPATPIESYQEWEPLVVSLGYKFVYFDGLNRFYVSEAHRELEKAFLAAPNIFDGFVINGTSSFDLGRLLKERHTLELTELRLEFENQTKSSQQEIEQLNLEIRTREQAEAEQARNQVEREQAMATRLLSALEENHRLEQEGSEREKILAQDTRQARQDLDGLLRHTAAREQFFAEQLLQLHQETDRDRGERDRLQIEREQALVQSAREERLRLEKEGAERESILAQDARQARQDLEGLLRYVAEREKELGEHLLQLRQETEKDRAEQNRIQAEREQAFIRSAREERLRLEKEGAERERVLAQNARQISEELNGLFRQMALREKEFGEQLLQLRQEAEREKDALARTQAEREQALLEQLQAVREEQHRIALEATTREQDLVFQLSRTLQELDEFQRTATQREKDFSEQLKRLRQENEKDRAELAGVHAEREQALTEQLLAEQQELARLLGERTQAEEALSLEIADLQSEIQEQNQARQLQAQQLNADLTAKQDELNRLLENYDALEVRLNTQMVTEQQTRLQLQQTVAAVERQLALTHTSLSWRMTAPFRKVASFFTQTEAPGELPSMEEWEGPAPRAAQNTLNPAASGSRPTNVQSATQRVMEPTMLTTAQPSGLNVTAALTLDDLLAHQDQAFIHCAYQTLLGRGPEEEGLRYYLERLRNGIPKIHILGQIRSSEEGKDYAAKLPRLDAAIRRYRWAQKPLVGWLVRVFYRVEGNNMIERKLRCLENQLFRLSEGNRSLDRIFLLAEESNRRAYQTENTLTKMYQLVNGQMELLEYLAAAMDRLSHDAPGTSASAPPSQPAELEGRQLPPRAQDIYLQLKNAVGNQVRKVA